MAIFHLSKKNNSKNRNIKKIVGWVMLAVASIFFLFSVTSIWPAFQYFLRGVFGLFIYPLTILMMIVALALLNNKKYVMSKRYAIFLSLSIIMLLSIIQLIIVGNNVRADGSVMSYGEYLLLSYNKQLTAGGILIGFITSSLVSVVGLAATYIILSLLLIVFAAFFVEEFISSRKNAKEASPVKIQLKEKKSRESKQEVVKRQEVNVVLNAHIEEDKTREQLAKEKLGLLSRTQVAPKFKEEPKQPEPAKPANLKEYLLTPPKVDMDKFMASQRRVPEVKPQEIQTTFNEMKSESIKPSQYLFEEQYNAYSEPQKRGNIPEIKPEQLVSEADDIIRSVVEEELNQMEEPIAPSPTIPERSFNRDTNNSFERRDSGREPLIRDSLANRDTLGRDNMVRNSFERDNIERAQTAAREANHIEERGKRFVSLDSDEGETSFKPYKYNKPSIDLIKTQSDDLSTLNDEVPAKRVALENALESFGVPAKVQSVVIGPTVTRYEIAMPDGISVKKILSLDADIAYALSAKGEIRIEAPVPGRSIVGIEVPNNKVAKVSIKDVLQSKEFTMSPSPLLFTLGKDITGTVRICNLQKMPHLLVAGTTGSGKSVCLNSIIVSMLYRASPDDVKFIMIDPKQVELSMYEGLPHMVIPKVITDPVKAVNALQWAVDEMEKRFNLISDARVRNIDEYNKTDEVVKGKKKKIPFLVIIFDEFADFMLVAKNEIEDKIRRLAQKARAAGIHLILATQRPSTDVVTGTIKANFPARIAFKVAGRVDSEVIMGATGAEKLLGYGDMLYKPTDSAPARIQGCFIDTPETKDIVNYIIENNEEVIDQAAQDAINGKSNNSGGGSGDDSGMDPLLPQALKICIDVGVASTTMVQRKLSIGYPRAARIIDQMEERGYISTAEGSKQRTVYTSIEEFYEIFGDTYD